MEHIEAIYQGGVFKPEGEVHLRENQRVRLSIEPVATEAWRTWLDAVKQTQHEMLQRRGGVPLPDSTADIAEDRMRDV